MSHNDLPNYYQIIYYMNRHYNFSHSEIENMIPFERDLYFDMIMSENEKRKMAYNAGNREVEYAFGE